MYPVIHQLVEVAQPPVKYWPNDLDTVWFSLIKSTRGPSQSHGRDSSIQASRLTRFYHEKKIPIFFMSFGPPKIINNSHHGIQHDSRVFFFPIHGQNVVCINPSSGSSILQVPDWYTQWCTYIIIYIYNIYIIYIIYIYVYICILYIYISIYIIYILIIRIPSGLTVYLPCRRAREARGTRAKARARSFPSCAMPCWWCFSIACYTAKRPMKATRRRGWTVGRGDELGLNFYETLCSTIFRIFFSF